MKVMHVLDVPATRVEMEGAQDCMVRWLISQRDGAPTFAMRHFELAPGGHTPRHRHPYEHEIFVLEGEGVAVEGDRARPMKAGDVLLVQPDEVHQFRNTGAQPLRMLCLIPNTAANQQVTVVPECGVEPRSP
jgi:quercetin dioxygenase-like cupin family protein